MKGAKKQAPQTPLAKDPPVAKKTRSSARKKRSESNASTESGNAASSPKESTIKSPIKFPSSRRREKRPKKDVKQQSSEQVADPSSLPVKHSADRERNKKKIKLKSAKSQKRATPQDSTPALTPSTDLNVHRIRHLGYQPKPILCIRATPQSESAGDCCVAISRDNGSVELKSAAQKFRTIATVAGYREKQINVMAWTCSRSGTSSSKGDDIALTSTLVGASQDGTIFIVDFASGQLAGMTPSGGGGVFALTSLCQRTSCSGSCGQLVAAGCEDGSVRIYRVDAQQQKLEMVSIVPSAGSPVLSLTWSRQSGGATVGTSEQELAGTVIFAGIADGTLRRYDCHGGKRSLDGISDRGVTWKSSLRMTVESYGRNIPTRVWTLSSLADGTVISGDSLGHVQFWDGNSGTLQQTFDQNDSKADVLDLDVSADGCKVFASGIDSRVVCIERPAVEAGASSSEPRKWIMSTAQRPHTHDVKAVAICREPIRPGNDAGAVKEILCTGGVDTKLCTYEVKDFQKKRPRTVYPWPSSTPISVSAEARLLMIRREDRVELHRLGPKQLSTLSSPVVIPDDETLVGTVEVKSASNLACATLSANGRYLAISDASSLFLFTLTFEQEGRSTTMIPSRLPLSFPAKFPVSAMRFLPSNLLVVTESNGTIHTVSLSAEDTPKATLEQSISHGSKVGKDGLMLPVQSISIMQDDNWFVTCRNGFEDGTIQVFRKDDGGKYRHWWNLPSLEVPHSALTLLQHSSPQLAVACIDFSLYVFDLQERRLSSWSEDAGYPVSKMLPTELSHRSDYPVRLGINPDSPSKVFMVRHLVCA